MHGLRLQLADGPERLQLADVPDLAHPREAAEEVYEATSEHPYMYTHARMNSMHCISSNVYTFTCIHLHLSTCIHL